VEALQTEDRRAARSRRAILGAFVELVLERRYETIRVGDIVAKADVGRSTFYEHYRSKDDLLHNSMEWLLALIADAAVPGGDEARLRFAVAHFWDNRRLARVVMAHPLGTAVRRALAGLIETRLAASGAGDPDMVPARAVQIAAGQLALLESWTKGEVAASQDQIVAQLQAAARV
jgi:AcrR family transcriptional regulator